MNIDQGIALITSLGTGGLAVLAYLSLREAMRQRQASYRPQLALKQQPIYGADLENLATWRAEEITPDHISPQQLLRYGVRLYNIGLGPAKNIKAKWAFDASKLSEEVNRLSKISGSKRAVKKCTDRFLEISGANGLGATFFFDADLNQKFDFALPYSHQSEGLEVFVPATFTAMVTMYLVEALLESKETKVKNLPDNLLEASLAISFSDIGGQAYSQKFRAKVNLGALMHASEGRGAKFFGTLDFDTK